MASGRTLGLPLRCPKCPPKHYFGLLKGDTVPTQLVKYSKSDVCPNCRTQLEAGMVPMPPKELLEVVPKQTADLVALILAIVVAVVIISTTLALLYVSITGTPSETGMAAEAISRFVSVIIAALVGYMAGRQSTRPPDG